MRAPGMIVMDRIRNNAIREGLNKRIYKLGMSEAVGRGRSKRTWTEWVKDLVEQKGLNFTVVSHLFYMYIIVLIYYLLNGNIVNFHFTIHVGSPKLYHLCLWPVLLPVRPRVTYINM